jgi:hypothetical protein
MSQDVYHDSSHDHPAQELDDAYQEHSYSGDQYYDGDGAASGDDQASREDSGSEGGDLSWCDWWIRWLLLNAFFTHQSWVLSMVPSEGAEVSGGPPGTTLVLERTVGEGKVERRYSDGTRIVTFRNGTEKELAPDGTSIVRFVNGDVKQVPP